MRYYVVDVEADGPIPGKYSMVSFAAVKVTPELNVTFVRKVKPISNLWTKEALDIVGITREEHLKYSNPKEVMEEFMHWVLQTSRGRPIFMSDNNGFDFAWINYYFIELLGKNPFGWSSRRIGDIYCGMQKDMFVKWKFLRETKHTHDPLDDAMGNAEAIIKMKELGLKINLK